jgi:hypothetical protein
MNEDTPNPGSRRLVFLLSGLIDMILGAGLLLAWVGILPVDLSAFNLPHWLVGGVGVAFFLSGTAVFVYQLTKPMPPE